MVSKKLEKAINEQINAEIYSAYLYLSMSSFFEAQSLDGFANWMYIQYQEEWTHAMKFFHYLHDRGAKVELKAVEAPPATWPSILKVMEEVLKHEQLVTSLINKLVDIAIDDKDHVTKSFLQWYLDEQVEEESNAMKLIDKVNMVKDSKHGILILDKELTARTFVDETAAKK